ncbi:hypothetical protein K523DRAFT_381520, partial [Schizophyllum commune Tattone D]
MGERLSGGFFEVLRISSIDGCQEKITPEWDLRITNICLAQDLHKEAQKQRIVFSISYENQAFNAAVLTPLVCLELIGRCSFDLVGYNIRDADEGPSDGPSTKKRKTSSPSDTGRQEASATASQTKLAKELFSESSRSTIDSSDKPGTTGPSNEGSQIFADEQQAQDVDLADAAGITRGSQVKALYKLSVDDKVIVRSTRLSFTIGDGSFCMK